MVQSSINRSLLLQQGHVFSFKYTNLSHKIKMFSAIKVLPFSTSGLVVAFISWGHDLQFPSHITVSRSFAKCGFIYKNIPHHRRLTCILFANISQALFLMHFPCIFLSDPGLLVRSMCLEVSNWVSKRGLWNLTDVTLADEDTNSILTDKVNRTIQCNVAMQV